MIWILVRFRLLDRFLTFYKKDRRLKIAESNFSTIKRGYTIKFLISC